MLVSSSSATTYHSPPAGITIYQLTRVKTYGTPYQPGVPGPLVAKNLWGVYSSGATMRYMGMRQNRATKQTLAFRWVALETKAGIWESVFLFAKG